MLGWFFHRYLLLLVLLIPLWSMGVQASTDPTGQSDYERGMAELKQGQNKKALYWLKQATKKDPEKGLYWFNLGNLYFVMQNYREAQVAYRQVQALESPLSPVAGLYEVRSLRQSARLAPAYRLYLKLKRGLFPENLKKELDEEHTLLAQSLLEKGLTLWSKGLNRAARHHLRASAELNPSLQVYKALALLEWRDGSKRKGRYYYRRAMRLASSNAEIQEMEKDWRQVDRGKITRFWLESGLIHNDNYFNDDSNTDGESGQGVKLQTGLEGYLGEGDNWDLSGRIKATHTDYTNLDNQETSVIGAYFPFAYAGGDNHRWRVTPKVEQELFLGKPLLLHGGLVLEWVRPLGVGQIISASGELIKSTAQNNDFSFLDGGTVNAGLAYSWIWSRSRLKLQILAEDYQADPYEDGLGGSLPLAHHRWELSLTYGLRGEIWEGFGSVSYGEKSFPNFLLPDNKLREDQVLSLKSGAEWRLGDEFQIFVEVEWLDNVSTLGESASINKNYNQTVVYLGGRWTTEN